MALSFTYREEFPVVRSGNQHDNHNDSTKENTRPRSDICPSRAPRRLPRPQKITNAITRGNPQSKRNRIQQLIRRGNDTLRCKRNSPQSPCHDCDNLEGEPFCPDLKDAHERELNEEPPASEGAFGPAAPGCCALDESGVTEEKEEGEPVSYSCCGGCAEETEIEGVDEKIVEDGVEGGGDEKDVT
jgi:hypothetical protein